MESIHQDIVIENETALYREIRIIKRTPLEALTQEMGRYGHGIVPRGTVFYAHTSKKSVYSVEVPEETRVIRYSNQTAGSHEIRGELTLKFPPLLFTFLFKKQALENTWVHVLDKPHLNSIEQDLFILPLTNIWEGGKICMGEGLLFDSRRSLTEKIEIAQKHFWESVFNRDITSHVPSGIPTEIVTSEEIRAFSDPIEESLKKWESFSAQDTLMHSLSWKVDKSLSALITKITGESL